MKYRLLLIGLLSLLFVSCSFNFIHSELLAVSKHSMEIESKMYSTIVNQLYDRINELEN